tara:strand:+ start:281 stop:472 length:192 start_codon:yes stop_codon:yes gene_type:complete
MHIKTFNIALFVVVCTFFTWMTCDGQRYNEEQLTYLTVFKKAVEWMNGEEKSAGVEEEGDERR